MMTTKPCPNCEGHLRVALLDVDSFESGVECTECLYIDDTTDGYLTENEPAAIEMPC
jgi:Zn ribbon nucleic-acid-binding protein